MSEGCLEIKVDLSVSVLIEWVHVVPTTECVMSKSIVERLQYCVYAVFYLALTVRSSHHSYEGQRMGVCVCYIA